MVRIWVPVRERGPVPFLPWLGDFLIAACGVYPRGVFACQSSPLTPSHSQLP